MESTLFATLTPNEEANLSGGTLPSATLKLKLVNVVLAKNKVAQKAIGGKGGNGGTVTVGGKDGKDSPIFIVGSPISADGGDGGAATNSSNNAVGAGG